MPNLKSLLRRENIYIILFFGLNLAVFFLLSKTNHILWDDTYYLPSLMTFIWIGLLLLVFTILILKSQEETLKKQFKLILGLSGVIFLFLIFLPPVTSADIFQYIFQGKIFNFYHQNPYLFAPNNFTSDPLEALTSGPKVPSMYGPLWTLIVIGYNFLSQQNVALNIILLKFNNLIFIALSAWLIFKLLKKYFPGHEYKGLTFWLLNPVILFESLLEGHNDLVMTFFFLAAIYFLLQRRYLYVLPLFIMSVLIKYITIIFLPFILLYWFYDAKPLWPKIKDLIYSLVLSVIVIVLAWWPFYQGLETFKGIGMVSKINSNFLVYFLNNFFGYFYFDPRVYKFFMLGFLAICYCGFLYQFYNRLKNKSLTPIYSIYLTFTLFLAYFILGSFWLQTWYLVLLIPFAALLISDWQLIIILNAFYFFLLLYFALVTSHYI